MAGQAKLLTNESGNTALHWAVQNKHAACVKLLLAVEGCDVLEKNGFGKGALTEAFGGGEVAITQLLLEHPSATALEDKTAGGGEPEGTAADSAVVQTHTHALRFAAAPAPALAVREVGTEWTGLEGAVFAGAEAAAEDTTGTHIWAASLVFARWIVQLAPEIEGRTVLELGAGAGVPGLAALGYAGAARVTLTDLHEHTMKNLRFNVAANLKALGRDYGTVSTVPLDWSAAGTSGLEPFDVALGSDLVYDVGLVEPLADAVVALLKPGGTLYMVAGDGRRGVPELVTALEQRGFAAEARPAPAEMYANPIVDDDDGTACSLHFNELEDNRFTLHTFVRGREGEGGEG